MTWRVSKERQSGVHIGGYGVQRGLQAMFGGGGGLGVIFGGSVGRGVGVEGACSSWGLLEGAWNKKYSKVSLELGGGRSPKNAKGVRGRSWKNSEMFSEQKTGRPLTQPQVSSCLPQGRHL